MIDLVDSQSELELTSRAVPCACYGQAGCFECSGTGTHRVPMSAFGLAIDERTVRWLWLLSGASRSESGSVFPLWGSHLQRLMPGLWGKFDAEITNPRVRATYIESLARLEQLADEAARQECLVSRLQPAAV